MQGLTKSETRIGKFVPHGSVPSTVTDLKQAPGMGRRTAPTLKPESFDQLAHDTRNALSALKLYCELLADPGVLSPENRHYAQELEAISELASKLVERLSAPLRVRSRTDAGSRTPAEMPALETNPVIVHGLIGAWPAEGIDDLGRELLEMRSLLAGIAGPRVRLEMAAMPCAGQCRLSKEDLTRVMLNLVRNASEAMPEGGRLRITAQYGGGLSFLDPELVPGGCPCSVAITVEDSGPGIPKEMWERIFLPGFTTREQAANWPDQPHRGLGLSIVRNLVEASGGTARVSRASGGGARFELVLPVTSGTYEMANATRLVADPAGEACIECP